MDPTAFDIGTVIALGSLIVTVVKLYLDQIKSRKEIELSKQYVHTLSKLSTRIKDSGLAEIESKILP